MTSYEPVFKIPSIKVCTSLPMASYITSLEYDSLFNPNLIVVDGLNGFG